MRNREDLDLVWVIEEEVIGEAVSLGPYHAVVRFVKNGIEYEIMLQREEFMFMDNTRYEGPEVDFCGFGDSD